MRWTISFGNCAVTVRPSSTSVAMQVRVFTDATTRYTGVESLSEEIVVVIIRNNWERFIIARRERLLRRTVFSLAIALMFVLFVPVLGLGWITYGFSREYVACTGPCPVLNGVFVSAMVLATIVAVLAFVRALVLLVLAVTSALQRKRSHRTRLA